MKCITDFKRDYGFGGTGGGRLRKPCRDCLHYGAERCRHPDLLTRFGVCKEDAPYKGCKRGWTARKSGGEA